MKILGVIPARMAATRFPDKPMANILGMPMIGHCYFRSKLCSLFDEVFVATCDFPVKEYIESVGGKAVITSDVHERASERSAEALLNIEKELGKTFDIVVMIQGDEPLLDPDMIREVIEPLLDGKKPVSNLMVPLTTYEECLNSNNVKVVTDIHMNAMYMSREPIPSNKKYKGVVKSYRQLGLIAFSREALLTFVNLPATPLEIVESVDMNRFLENGIPIQMLVSKYEADSVDTPDDLLRVSTKMEKDVLYASYRK